MLTYRAFLTQCTSKGRRNWAHSKSPLPRGSRPSQDGRDQLHLDEAAQDRYTSGIEFA
jgi:hypothetical protein